MEKPSIWVQGWKTVEKLGLKSIVTGNFGWFIVLVVTVFAIYKLDSKGLKEVLLTVFQSYGWLGWPVALITALSCARLLRWREKFYQAEMERNSNVKKVLLQQGFEMPLESSTKGKK